MSVVVLAYHELGFRCLRVLLQRGIDVSAVFTYEDDPDENCWFGSVGALARDAGIRTHTTPAINDPEWVALIAALQPEALFSFYYRDLVRRPIRELARHGCYNLHGSLLPAFRGRSPLNWQLVHGVTESGVTLHAMTGRADAGDIVDQERVAVGPDDTALELYGRLLPAAERVLARSVDAILAGRATLVPQDESRATTFGGRTPADGRIRWDAPRLAIHDLVRAVARPWPGAFCEHASGRLAVWRTTHVPPPLREPVSPAGMPAQAGTLAPGVVRVHGGRVCVGARDGALEILEHELPGGGALRDGDLLT